MSDPAQRIVPLEHADFSRPPPSAVVHNAPVYLTFNTFQLSNDQIFPLVNSAIRSVQLPQSHTLSAWPREVQNPGMRPVLPQQLPSPSMNETQFMNNQGRPVWPQQSLNSYETQNHSYGPGFPQRLPNLTETQSSIQSRGTAIWPQQLPAYATHVQNTPYCNNRLVNNVAQHQGPGWAQVVRIEELPPDQPQLAIGWQQINETVNTANPANTMNIAPLRRSARNTASAPAQTATHDIKPLRQRREQKKELIKDQEEESSEEECAKASKDSKRKPKQEDTSDESEQDALGRWLDGEEDISPDEGPAKKKLSKANKKKIVDKVEKAEALRKNKKQKVLSDSDSDFEKEAKSQSKSKSKKKVKEVEPKFFVPKRGKASK